jgi:DNA-binding NarL/FixJ family response regulator
MSATDRLQCVIVDDNARFRAAASEFLGAQGIEVLGVASDCAEALSMVEELRPHVTLVDVDLGGECGFNLAEQLHRRQAVVIMMSSYANGDFSELVSESPAVGFLTKFELSSAAIRKLLLCNSSRHSR